MAVFMQLKQFNMLDLQKLFTILFLCEKALCGLNIMQFANQWQVLSSLFDKSTYLDPFIVDPRDKKH